ncbi:MAG TPA: tyrosine-type recombinase/integrase [Steroidobacteraceae bacterium]|nr:tyrosine-type recombinase/integrase [Steroidobacteraceae bacterium]
MSEINQLTATPTPSPGAESGNVLAFRKARVKPSHEGDYLTEKQVEALIDAAATSGRYPQRDRTLVLLLFRHGLRSIEAINLRWSHVHLDEKRLRVERAKNGNDSTHPLTGRELRELRQLKRDWPDSPWVFVSERGKQMTTSNVRKLIARLGEAAKFEFPVHPHQLRHACGHYLAEAGKDTRAIQDYLGHRNIAHTVRYTTGTSARFDGFFRD